jgi:outer membrane receptor protein involved in Fe transport
VPIPKGVTVISPYGPGPLGVPGEPFIAKLNETNVSWKAGINFQAAPRALFYGTVSKGYKSGSFPSLAAATMTPLLPVTQESVLAYEIGAKLQSSDHKLSLNSAAFYYDYRNKQVRGKLLDPIFGDLEAEVNVPKSRIWGLEADVTVREIPEITITGGVTYLNSKVLTYTGVDAVGNANQNLPAIPCPSRRNGRAVSMSAGAMNWAMKPRSLPAPRSPRGPGPTPCSTPKISPPPASRPTIRSIWPGSAMPPPAPA